MSPRLERGNAAPRSLASSTAGGDEAKAAAVHAEKIRTLYRQSPLIMAVNPVNAAIVGTVLWSPARAAIIVAWVIAAAAVTGVRAAFRAYYLKLSPPVERARVWGRRYVALAALGGLVWGVGSLLLYSPGAEGTELILVFVVGGMAAGAAGTMAYHLPAFLAFMVPTLLPLSVRLLAEGDRMHLAMGSLGLVFGLALVLIAANTHRAIAEALKLRFENADLLARLSQAQVSLEEANRTLEERVAERGRALERQAESLRDARRMESLGLLAGGVAHDFNNLLTVILGNVAPLLEVPDLPATTREPLRDVYEAGQRAVTLVSQLLAFSRRQPRKPRVVDLNGVVAALQRLLARLIGENIEVVVALHAAPLPIYADPAQLEQVIINLATNARDAMAAGGTLTIETQQVRITPDGAPQTPGLDPGEYAMLLVRDTGVGMDAKTRRMAFDPFFTTKGVGRGTGLGLATVHGIVEQSGGHIFVDSEPGAGSWFRVFLPRTERLLEPELTPEPLPSSPGEQATVLLVEDEPLVRSVVARTFAEGSFTVLEAEDGEQALARASAHAGVIDLVVTDVVMKHMGGIELAQRLLEVRPEICVLFISGYSQDAIFPEADVARGVDFLQKPFTTSALFARARQLLARARRRASAQPAGAASREAADRPGWGRS